MGGGCEGSVAVGAADPVDEADDGDSEALLELLVEDGEADDDEDCIECG